MEHKTFTKEQLTEKFDFNGRLKTRILLFGIIGLVLVAVGLFVPSPLSVSSRLNPDAGHHGHGAAAHHEEGDAHHEEAAHAESHEEESHDEATHEEGDSTVTEGDIVEGDSANTEVAEGGEEHGEEGHDHGEDHAHDDGHAHEDGHDHDHGEEGHAHDDGHEEGTAHTDESHEEHGHGEDHGGHAEHKISAANIFSVDFLHANLFFFTIAIGGLFFIVVHTISHAGWHVAIKRIPEAMSTYMYVGIAFFIGMFFFMDYIFEWLMIPVGSDPLIDAKRAYLQKPGFIIRNLVVFAIWLFCAWQFRKLSVEEDENGGISYFKKSFKYAAFFVVFFAFSYSLFSIDWIKSLEPHWFSTIFGVYVFGGSMQAAMAVMVLLFLFLRENGYMSYANENHAHDAGKYLFGFSAFWGYIWLAQFLLIWYSNIPEETIYYIKRYGALEEGGLGYSFLFFANPVINFLIPFLVLMTRDSKRVAVVLRPIAILVLFGHWLDLFLMTMPGTVGEKWGVGFLEIGLFLTLGSIFLFVVLWSLSKANLVAKGNPYLDESLNHHTEHSLDSTVHI